MEVNGRHSAIKAYYPLKSVVVLGVEGLQVLRGEVRRGEPKVEEDRGEVVHRGARPPLSE